MNSRRRLSIATLAAVLEVAAAPYRLRPVVAAPRSFPMNLNPGQMNWQKMEPGLGDGSPERVVLHEDPVSHVTQFMIRLPKNFQVPGHWHHANETHTVVSGSLIVEEAGKRIVLRPGGFNFTPATLVHRTSTSADEGAVLFVTVDGPFDQFLEEPTDKRTAGK